MTDRARKFGVPQIAAVAVKDNIIYEGMRGLEQETGKALSDLNNRVLQLAEQAPTPPAPTPSVNDRGYATLVAGTVRVYSNKLTYTSTVMVCHRGPAVLGTLGQVYAWPTKRNPGAGYFDVDSSDATDDSEVEWIVDNE